MKQTLALAISLFAAASFAQLPPARQEQIAGKRIEVNALKVKATTISKAIRKLSAETDVTSSDDALKLLKQYVDELGEVRDRLKQVEDQLGEMQGLKKSVESTRADVTKLKSTQIGGLVQFQYQSTDKKGASTFDAFRLRRTRLIVQHQVDPRISAKIQEELTSGTNTEQAFLKDAVVTFDMTPHEPLGIYKLYAGQFNLPLGFELEQSDFDRQLPERSIYNQTYNLGERSRGVNFRTTMPSGLIAQLGLWNSLSTEDPEQVNLAAGTGNRLAVTGGLRQVAPKYSIGVSGLVGQRPSYTSTAGDPTTTSPETDRRLLYVDGELKNVVPRLNFRGEVVFGHDRIPNAVGAPSRDGKNLRGFQLLSSYNFNAMNELTIRWDQLDPDTDTGGNAVNGVGLAYRYRLNPDANLTLSQEVYTDESRAALGQTRYELTTLRLNVKF